MNPYKTLVSIALTVLMLSCAMTHSLQRSTPTADIHLPGNGPVETPEVEDVERAVTQMRKISMNGGRDSAYLAEVERDSTGEVTIKGENIQTVYIVAKSKTVAERNGEIAIDFIVGIPRCSPEQHVGVVAHPDHREQWDGRGAATALYPG